MVGYRNRDGLRHERGCDFIRHSDGGVSEQSYARANPRSGLYQAFRWWGIGTSGARTSSTPRTLSGIPMVGYRNVSIVLPRAAIDFIRHSDGGVSELGALSGRLAVGLYQAFRWWGIGTIYWGGADPILDFIRHSDGGVSERAIGYSHPEDGLYQAFRWWGIGTRIGSRRSGLRTLSGIPMVGYRNSVSDRYAPRRDFIRHSDGGVSEPKGLARRFGV